MKKKFTLLMMLAFLGLNIGALRAQTIWGGSGTESDPYTISNAAGLVELATNVNAGNSYSGKYFKLANDIDLSDVCSSSLGSWVPIGAFFEGTTHGTHLPFKGVFDGNGKTISNLYINNTEEGTDRDEANRAYGLFGYVSNGTIKNLSVTGEVSASGYSAGICAVASCTNFDHCVNKATVSSVYNSLGSGSGGVCGVLYGEIESHVIVSNCSNTGNISSYEGVGGVIGHIQYGEISYSTNSGDLRLEDPTATSLSWHTAGGVCGDGHGLLMTHCKNYGDVFSHLEKGGIGCGGIVGGSLDIPGFTCQVSDCQNEGKVSGAIAAGIIPIHGGPISNCDNSGVVEGYLAAGICASASSISGCHNLGNITASYGTIGDIEGGKAAGICALPDNTTIHECVNSANVTGLNLVGGIIADGNKIVVENCTNSGEIEGFQFVGGICGKLKDSEVTACQNSGAVTGNYAGGIVGDGEIIEVANCTNLGEIDGAQSVGGITGMLASGTISSSFNTGDIEFNGSGAATVGGGIVGSVVSLSPDAVGSTIQYCYNMGNIKSNSISESERVLLGGIVGMLQEDGSVISNCYNSGVLSSVEVSEGVAVCIGGIISYISNNTAVSLTNSYNVGNFVYPNATVLVLGGVVAAVEGEITISNCFYDKQMCPVVNEFCPDADGTPLLTSAMTNGTWNLDESVFEASAGLYPQLKVFAESADEQEETASLVSVTPAFLANEENVEGVSTDFTVGIDNDVVWSHVSGDEVLDFDGASVEVLDWGTETVAVSKAGVSKYIRIKTNVPCWYGSGTEADPYQIVDADGLVCLAEKVNAGNSYAGIYFKQTADIDLSSVCGEGVGNWTPIGTSSHSFKGVFDGDGKTISNLYINAPETNYQGLFGSVESATIKNLMVAESQIIGSYRIGAICGEFWNTTFTSCSTLASVEVSGISEVGGLLGYNYSFATGETENISISNCINRARVIGRGNSERSTREYMNCAGIVGYASASQVLIENCDNYGEIESNFMQTGGIGGLISGDSESSHIKNCNNYGKVTSRENLLGGIVGGSEISIIECTNFGAVSGTGGLVGGICGYSGKGINACVNEGTVNGAEISAGIVGFLYGNGTTVTVSNSTNNGKVTGTAYTAGIVSYANAIISNCTNTGEIVADNRAAGIVVELENGSISNCTNYGTIQGTGSAAGIVHTYNGPISNCSNYGSIEGTQGAAGIVLMQDGGTISNCSNYGNISGKMGAAGIAGMVEDAPVIGCMNYGAVECDPGEITMQDLAEGNFTPAAGVVAVLQGSSTVSSSVNCGWVKNGHLTGGICGFIRGYENDAVGHPVVDKCMNFGPIEGNDVFGLVGGVVGNCSHSSPGLFSNGIQNCYNAGMVSAHGVSGGIAGYCEFDLTNCYNVGNVYSTDSELVNYGGRSGIVGILADDYDETLVPQVINCYYDKQMCTAEYMYYFSEDTEPEHLFNPTPVLPAEGQTLLTSSMIGAWNPLGDAFATAAGLYPQLTVFSASSNDLTKAASIVSVTPAFLENEENVEGVATSPFTVGTGNSVSWSAASPFSYSEGEVFFSTEGTGTLTISKTVSDITVSKDIVMTTIIEDVCWAGSGTEADPYQIVDADGLVCLAEKVNAGESYAGVYFKMMNDIDLSSVCGEGNNWRPIGGLYYDNELGHTVYHPFSGVFDGGNHTISNLYIKFESDYVYYQALFGYVANCEFKNLTIGSSYVHADREIGLLCGRMESGTIRNCIIDEYSKVIGERSVGGICGQATGTCMFEGCSNYGNIVADAYDDEKNREADGCGGILGYYSNGMVKIRSCYNYGPIEADIVDVGGIVGQISYCSSGSLIDNCHNIGTLRGYYSFGGICGYLSSNDTEPYIDNCSNSGLIEVKSNAGGICAWVDNAIIMNCYNTGAIKGESIGGLCGDMQDATVSNCYNLGTLEGSIVGGLCAGMNASEIKNSFNLGSVKGVVIDEEDLPFAPTGGLVGRTENESNLTDCYNAGWVQGVGVAGGLVGWSEEWEEEGHELEPSTFNRCYNIAPVLCEEVSFEIEEDDDDKSSEVSGRFGKLSKRFFTFGSAKQAMTLNFAGGLVGMVMTASPTISNCYYDKQMCPNPNVYYLVNEETFEFSGISGEAYQKLTTEMVGSALSSEYTDGWTFVGSGYTALYPQLTAFVESENDIDNEASLVSVRPMFLAETDNVDHVYTSPFTVGIDDDEEWSHVSGDELLTFNTDGTVEWENYGTETVAVTNMTHTFITKQIKLTTANAENVTWVDWVTEAPDGFDPANIDSPEDLAWFISYVNGFNGSDAHPSADGEITADIDMSEHCWVPIGFNCGHIREGFYRPYGGSFEGNYHNIDGIRIKWEALKNSPVINALPTTGGKDGYRDNYDCIGMFGLMNGGSIRNLNLASATIEDDLEGEKAMTIGGIVGETRGTKIYSCVSNATITASRYQKIGGMVGEAKVYSSGVDDKNPASDRDDIVESVFDNCMSTATLTGLGEMGGIVGVAEGASLVSCYSYAQFLLAGDDTKDSGGATIGGLVGRSGRNYPSRLENCYVRMREDGKSELNKGGGSDFIVGLLIGSDNGGEVSYCYAPENTGFEYIGQASGGVPQFERATSIEDIFGTSKGDDYYIGLAVQESENSYYVANLVRDNGTIEVNSCSADVIGEKVVLLCYPEWEIKGDSDQGFVFNDGKYDMSCTSDGKLEFHYDMYSSYWDIESLTTTNGFSGFRITNKKYPYSLALYELDGAYVIGAVDYESNKDNPNYNFTFDIFAGRILPNLHGVGTYTPATYPYTYNDPKGGTVVTLDYPEDPEIPEEKRMVVSGETTLLDALNNWTLVDFYNKIITTDYGNEGTDWARFGSSLNGDYPIHCYYEPDNVKYGDVALPTAKVVSTPDKMNGIPFRYYSRVSDALAYYNAQAAGGIMGVYGSDDMRDAAVRSNDDNVDVYVNAVSYVNCPKAKEEPYGMITFFGDKALRCSNDWYVSLLQGSGSTLNVHSGFYLDNSDASGEVGGKAYDWHMVSSPLAHVPVGIAYADNDQHPYMTPANCTWNTSLDGLFPTDTPLGSYDFYAYSEPDYHWINLKQNSASHYHQDGANEPIAYTNDTELTAGHGYLIAMDKEVFMQVSGVLNNGTVTVPVTYSGAHNKGLNFLGNPYMSSLDFDEFATENGTLWEGGAYAQSYITLDADKKGYITYAKGQSENPEGLSRYVWPNQGFYIAADKAGTATFTNAMRVIKTDAASYFRGEERPNYALVNLKATDSEGSRDMLTVELGRPEVGGARKVKDVENGNGILYSHYQGGDYSIVFTEEGISQVPVWFESREADSYTMTWSTYNGTFSYLHLIDNLTGCDVDMLTNSEYRFTSSTSDYASRFKLVFEYTGVEEDIDSDADGTFAFQMGEQIVVNGKGTLEIVDVQGRILRSERLSGVQSVVVPSVAKGLYLLRLSGSDSVKVQKIVIK